MPEKNKRPAAEVINPGLGDIEKVRDILFGKYVTDFEHRFAELEARLEADVDQLKDKLIEKMGSMDTGINQSLARVDTQILEEKSARDAELSRLQNTLREAESALQQAIASMEDQANQDLVVVRASLDQSHQDLQDRAHATQTELMAQIEQQREDLQNDKVGRQALALMLDEVAIKLRGN
ncbi:MAG: paraquat-inducible protein B [Arenicella sp.]|jgi:paraquat-inducible protein B